MLTLQFPESSVAETGLIIGKFLPPHLGHQYLFDFGRAYVERLTVLVCTLQREPIAGALRHRWVAEMCPDAEVLHVTDENPSEPHEHPQFWEIWTETIRRRVKKGPDVVFSSETYGDELARRLGARHVRVDLTRQLVPISGSRLRENPLVNWQFLPACVRPHFVKRVSLFGPESTGKTTLAQRLATHYQTVWNPEYARGYLDHQARSFEPADFNAIARGQLASEDAMARQASKVLFCDTDLLMSVVYCKLYYGSCPPWLEALAESRKYDLYLLNDVDVPWVPDPQRDMPHRRAEIFERCRHELESRGRKYARVRGTWDQRFETARAEIDRMLNGRSF